MDYKEIVLWIVLGPFLVNLVKTHESTIQPEKNHQEQPTTFRTLEGAGDLVSWLYVGL